MTYLKVNLELEASVVYNSSALEVAKKELKKVVKARASYIPVDMIPEEFHNNLYSPEDLRSLMDMTVFLRPDDGVTPPEVHDFPISSLSLGIEFPHKMVGGRMIVWRTTSMGSREVLIIPMFRADRNPSAEDDFKFFDALEEVVDEVKEDHPVFISRERADSFYQHNFTERFPDYIFLRGSSYGAAKTSFYLAGNPDSLIRHGRVKYFIHSYAALFPITTPSGQNL